MYDRRRVAVIVFGLILIAVAGAVGFGVAVSPGTDATLEIFGTEVDVTVAGVFFIGAAVAAVLLIGLWLVKTGLSRGHRRRREVKELRQQVEATPTAPTVPPDPTDQSNRDGVADDAPPDRATDPPGDAAGGGTAQTAHQVDHQNS
jgi:hypothetical protein